MNGSEILRLVDALHRDKNIDPEIVFEGIEQAILSAARKHFGEEAEIEVGINREDGQVSASIEGDSLNADEIGELLGRIAAQTAKQVMIQKIREAERDALHEEFSALKTQIMTGTVSRVDGAMPESGILARCARQLSPSAVSLRDPSVGPESNLWVLTGHPHW